MNNPKRVFANNNDISYVEYMSNLRGDEIYRTSVLNRLPEDKHKLFRIKGNELTNFINHETFLDVTKSFYKYNQPYEVYDECHPPVSIQDGAKSHIDYEVLLSHIKDCDYCCRCKNITEIYECNELKNFLYPYGRSELIKYPIFRFPIPLRLDDRDELVEEVLDDCHVGCCRRNTDGGHNKIYDKKCNPLYGNECCRKNSHGGNNKIYDNKCKPPYGNECCRKNTDGGYNKIYDKKCNPICKVDYTPVYKICTPVCKPICEPVCEPVCKPECKRGCKSLCKKEHDRGCDRGCKKEHDRGCRKEHDRECRKEHDRGCRKECCRKECCKKECCQNIYPSQYQFKYYDINCEDDCHKEKRINAYATYPQIRNNCGLIKPFPCNPCEPIIHEPCEPLITVNRCAVRKGKYDINICGGIPPSGCKCF